MLQVSLLCRNHNIIIVEKKIIFIWDYNIDYIYLLWLLNDDPAELIQLTFTIMLLFKSLGLVRFI